LNVCTADRKLIDAMLSGNYEVKEFSMGGEQMDKARQTTCTPSLQQVSARLQEYVPDPNERSALSRRLGQISNYFRLTTVVTIGTTQFTLYSLLYRNGGTISVISRSQTPD
jgi:hypothetical protein